MNSEYTDVCNYAVKNKVSLIDAETRLLGTNHAEIGKIISDKWSLPLDLEYTLVYHHNPGNADNLQELIATIHFANILAHHTGATIWEDEPIPKEWENYRQILQVSESDYTKIRQTLEDSIEKSVEFLNIIQ